MMSGETNESWDSNLNDVTNAPSKQSQQTLNSIANGTHLKQKRARSQLSCIPCRQGKLKCNRSHDPACDQCVKRNRETSCVYVPPPVKQKPAQNVKGRIRQLENLVVDLMNQQKSKPVQSSDGDTQQEQMSSGGETENYTNGNANTVPYSEPTPPTDDDSPPNLSVMGSSDGQDEVEAATKPFGQMRIGRDGISYVGETHWQAILNGISDLKRDLGDDEEGEADATNADEEEDSLTAAGFGNAYGTYVPASALQQPIMGGSQPAASKGLGFMLGSSTSMTKEQLIQAIPEKKKADRLLSLWFNSPDPFKPIIHAPTFQEEYRRFWRDPKQTPTMWLGLLYSIMSLAASFGLRDVDPTSQSAMSILEEVNNYHSLSASAAVLADFTKPKPHTIECLILFAAGLRSNDAFVNVWLMIGLVVRLCLRMGYHRDPGNYPQISVFNGEMRRRVWAIISMIDCLISFQLGLPSMVKTIQSDTLPPRNLLDRDFNVDTTELPSSRGIDELTPSSYTRAKLRLVWIFANAAELSHQTIPPALDEMMQLDRQLEEAKAAIPPLLQMPDFSELVTDPAEQLMCRFNLDLLYLKTKMVLHRKYMEKPWAQLSPEEQQMGIGQSRKICTSCALRVLQHHHTIYTASQPGGQLESVKWYMGSISTHDFLLAAMIICLELSQQIGNNPAMDPSAGQCPQRAAMMDALEKSHRIWSDASDRRRTPNQFVGKDDKTKGEHLFDETEKASRAMAVMLEKVKARFPQQATALAHTQGQHGSVQVDTTSASPNLDASSMPMCTSNGYKAPFGGIVSFHQWDDLNSVPDDLQFSNPLNSARSSNGTTSHTPSVSNHITPPYDTAVADFQMIGDMLDMQGNLDWEMFDSGVNTKGQQAHWIDNSNRSSSEGNGDIFHIGDNLTAGSGRVDMPLAGNVMVFGGTGPGSNGVNNQYPGSWMSFQNMDDVNFELGNLDDYPDRGGADFFGIPETTQGSLNGWMNGAS